MVDRPLLHDITQTTMTLITWEVIALIISRQHNIDNAVSTKSNHTMELLRAFLLTAILAIVAVTLYATLSAGINFPAVFFGDLLKLDWRSQINTDLMLHAGLLGIWVAWREGATPTGIILGLLCLLLDAVFGFPYVLLATYRAKGDPKRLLLGVHAEPELGA
jgi:hypothetical protein